VSKYPTDEKLGIWLVLSLKPPIENAARRQFPALFGF
jgi:hypothetical protein